MLVVDGRGQEGLEAGADQPTNLQAASGRTVCRGLKTLPARQAGGYKPTSPALRYTSYRPPEGLAGRLAVGEDPDTLAAITQLMCAGAGVDGRTRR